MVREVVEPRPLCFDSTGLVSDHAYTAGPSNEALKRVTFCGREERYSLYEGLS